MKINEINPEETERKEISNENPERNSHTGNKTGMMDKQEDENL
jgi:hypothetical protein